MSKITKKKKQAKLLEAKKYLMEIRKTSPNFGKVRCDDCGKWVEPEDMITGPDPFASAIYNNNTIVTQCKGCYNESCRDI